MVNDVTIFIVRQVTPLIPTHVHTIHGHTCPKATMTSQANGAEEKQKESNCIVVGRCTARVYHMWLHCRTDANILCYETCCYNERLSTGNNRPVQSCCVSIQHHVSQLVHLLETRNVESISA